MNDPGIYIIFSGILGGAIGFMGCGLMAAAQIRTARSEGWKEAMRFYARRERAQMEQEAAR